MRMASLHFCRLRPSQFERDQAWLEEDQTQPEAGYPTQCIDCAEIHPGIPKLRYHWMSSKYISLKLLPLILFPTSLPSCVLY